MLGELWGVVFPGETRGKGSVKRGRFFMGYRMVCVRVERFVVVSVVVVGSGGGSGGNFSDDIGVL